MKTRKIVVNAHGEAGQKVELEVPVIQQAVGGNLKVDGQGDLTSVITFEGAVPVAFGLQAVQVVFDESGEFLTTQQLSPGGAAARASLVPTAMPASRGPVFLEPRGAFVRMGE